MKTNKMPTLAASVAALVLAPVLLSGCGSSEAASPAAPTPGVGSTQPSPSYATQEERAVALGTGYANDLSPADAKEVCKSLDQEPSWLRQQWEISAHTNDLPEETWDAGWDAYVETVNCSR